MVHLVRQSTSRVPARREARQSGPKHTMRTFKLHFLRPAQSVIPRQCPSMPRLPYKTRPLIQTGEPRNNRTRKQGRRLLHTRKHARLPNALIRADPDG